MEQGQQGGQGNRQSHWTELAERTEQVLGKVNEVDTQMRLLRDQILGSVPRGEKAKAEEAAASANNFKSRMLMALGAIDEHLESIAANINDLQ